MDQHIIWQSSIGWTCHCWCCHDHRVFFMWDRPGPIVVKSKPVPTVWKHENGPAGRWSRRWCVNGWLNQPWSDCPLTLSSLWKIGMMSCRLPPCHGGFWKKKQELNYFTSCDPHHDIYTFCYWQIFWHSIWHIFWHSIWHSIWHIFWHSTWHIFWQMFLAYLLADVLAYLLAYLLAYVSGISSGIPSGILSGISFWHIIWQIFWHSIWHSI